MSRLIQNDGPDGATLLEIYRKFTLINRCDERFRTMINAGQVSMIYYSVRGQEMLAAVMGTVLEKTDYIVTTYRGMHDQIAKGVPLNLLWAEFIGKATGTCKGKGGPMHITHPQTGVMVTTGVVGSGPPIANGLALASQIDGDGRVTVVSFGDGATNIGAFHEALNMAQLWKLPVVFYCQNNHYAEHTAYADGTTSATIAARGASYQMRAVTVDGNDPQALYVAARDAVAHARDGKGPTLLEATTFRFKGHAHGSAYDYMPKDMYAAAEKVDPLHVFRPWLLEQGIASEEGLAEIERQADLQLNDAVEFALASPMPGPEEMSRDIFAPAAA